MCRLYWRVCFSLFSFLLFVWVAGIRSGLLLKLATHLVLRYFIHCRPVASDVNVFVFLFYFLASWHCLRLRVPSSPREFSFSTLLFSLFSSFVLLLALPFHIFHSAIVCPHLLLSVARFVLFSHCYFLLGYLFSLPRVCCSVMVFKSIPILIIIMS